ncbi:E3 ubiquitin-protein ligase MPSR1-like [Lycium ferocissimum]|uniref:E3 ubiquitin-protein ligase MPSR1-like n=1 Tax=Lycium ferocissimum TaxID=112874 RepID=UPI0028159D67|nr:E3 ubiquitin-protein ligase MPSR1-like [Lycium ferocissimum]
MASESGATDASSFIENLMNSRNRDISLFLPLILGLNNNSSNSSTQVQDSSNPNQETQEQTTPNDFLDRIILVNPLTQSMFVIETPSSLTFDSFFNELMTKGGQPPASKASIEALPRVEICEEEEKIECVVCLDELGVGDVAKEMPCKHRFHGDCVEKWLKIHGSCPICRYKMPEENGDLNNKSENRRTRREIWMSFSLGNNNQTVTVNSSSENEHDHAPEV